MSYKDNLTYEEAVQRKEELLQKINEYNIALLEGKEPPYTEEEIDEMSEEYQILNDSLKLTKEEKKQKDVEYVETEDGVVEKPKGFFDKIGIGVYIYSFIAVFLSSGILNSLIGTAIYNGVMNIIYFFMLKTENHLLMENMPIFAYGCIYFMSYLLLPILVIIATLIIKGVNKKKGKLENSKFLFWVLMIQIAVTLVVTLILFIGTLGPDFEGTFKETVDYGYPIYLYEHLYETDPDKFNEIMRMLGF